MDPDKNNDLKDVSEEEAPKDEQPTADSFDTSEPKDTSEPAEEVEQEAPSDALSMTPDELEDLEKESGNKAQEEANEAAAKKLPFFVRLARRVNIYFLIFLVILAIAGVIAGITYFNSHKPQQLPDIANQALTSETLKQLANNDASVGNTSQTLTIQGNAIIAGQTLARGNLNVAGSLQTGGAITAPSLTISGTSNLGTTQINDLQVAGNTSLQGVSTLRELNVSGASSFGGAMTAAHITVTRLTLSGNAVLEIPNHVSFTGTTPTRSINGSVIGNGGTLSLSGSDTTGTISLNTGTGTSAGCFARMTFQQAYVKRPNVIISPVGASAAQLQYYVDRDTNGFSVCTINTPPTNRSFSFDYFITF